MLGLGEEVLLRLTHLRNDNNPPLALEILAEGHPAVDFGDNRLLFRLPHLEQFGHPRQTTGDILGFCCFSRNFCYLKSWANIIVLINRYHSPNRQRIASRRFTARYLYGPSLAIFD